MKITPSSEQASKSKPDIGYIIIFCFQKSIEFNNCKGKKVSTTSSLTAKYLDLAVSVTHLQKDSKLFDNIQKFFHCFITISIIYI